ncbi:MAG: class I SAM-dependent methyltransferase [Gammaproteobacteria bacterium]
MSSDSSGNASVHRAAAEGFAAGAETYVRGRPEYPLQALEWLRNVIGLAEGKTAIDLGAGTGKFSKVMLATGAKVIAVDPVGPMLDRLRRDVPEVGAVVGNAEHIPLDAESADGVLCAQSFHWFATPSAVAEIRRVLRPGGALGLIWNVRDESVAWVAQLGAILEPYAGDAPRMTSGNWRTVFPAPGFGPLHETQFPHVHTGPPERVIVDRVTSISFIAALPASERDRVIARVRELIDATASLVSRDEVSFPYLTMAFHARATSVE